MGKKGQQQQQQPQKDHKYNDRVEAVLELLRKQAPLTVKQEKFCNNACVERFLRAKGDNVKKAAKHLRACLSWRESIGTENLIADEFSAELAEGVAYVAGHDEESRPVMIFRIKQDYQKFHSQKSFTRLLVFTLEVAIGTMPRNAEQFVLLFDASFFRSASAFMNLLLATLKIVAEYYPGRLCKAFVIDPPSLFSYLWKVKIQKTCPWCTYWPKYIVPPTPHRFLFQVEYCLIRKKRGIPLLNLLDLAVVFAPF